MVSEFWRSGACDLSRFPVEDESVPTDEELADWLRLTEADRRAIVAAELGERWAGWRRQETSSESARRRRGARKGNEKQSQPTAANGD